jgi:flagellar basal-body rod modification protein FlgD
MNTVGIDSIVAASAKNTLSNPGMMGKDDFLRMLTIQLRYQDPLNPMSNDQFASQLAQFSQLETLNNINDSIQTDILMSQSMNNSFMVNMIGKDVKSYGNLVTLDGDTATINFALYGDAQDVKVKIFDETGKEVAVINGGSMKHGDRRVEWDGMTKDGTKAAKGSYTFTVEAMNNNGVRIQNDPMNNGIVTGVVYEGGMPFLIINGNYVNLGDIISVNQPKVTESS